MPTIDAPHLVERALTSIQNTVSDLSKIHIYIIDDCSRYDYEESISKFKDLSISLLKTDKRSGPGPARNIGIKAGKNPYISFLDADDIFVEDILKYCNSYDYNYDVISTRVLLKVTGYCKIEYEDFYLDGIHGLIVSRSILQKYNLYFPEVKYASEDTIFRSILFSLTENKKFFDNSFYKYMENKESCFMHGLYPYTFLDEDEKKYLKTYEEITWLNNFLNTLKPLNLPKELLNSKHWNWSIVNIIDLFTTSFQSIDVCPTLAILIKQFVNMSLVDFSKEMSLQTIFLLSFIENNFTYNLNSNEIIFNPNEEDYKKYLNLLEQHKLNINEFYLYVKRYFAYAHPIYFNANEISCKAKIFYNTLRWKSEFK